MSDKWNIRHCARIERSSAPAQICHFPSQLLRPAISKFEGTYHIAIAKECRHKEHRMKDGSNNQHYGIEDLFGLRFILELPIKSIEWGIVGGIKENRMMILLIITVCYTILASHLLL